MAELSAEAVKKRDEVIAYMMPPEFINELSQELAFKFIAGARYLYDQGYEFSKQESRAEIEKLEAFVKKVADSSSDFYLNGKTRRMYNGSEVTDIHNIQEMANFAKSVLAADTKAKATEPQEGQ